MPTRTPTEPIPQDRLAGPAWLAAESWPSRTCRSARLRGVLAKGSWSCDTPEVSGFFLVMPTAGEYRVVAAAVQNCRSRVRLWRCGVGPGRAAAICAEFERGALPHGVALLGWAGGLADHLAVGDIVLADRALSASGRHVDCMRLELPALPRVYCGPLLTAERVLATPEAKRRAGKSGALAVEMEAYPLAAWAARHGVPFVQARVILDTVDEALPALDQALDGDGRLQMRPLLGALAARPALLGECVRFTLRLRRVNRRLAQLAEAVVVGTQSREPKGCPPVSQAPS